MRALLGTTDGESIRIYTRDDDDQIEQVGQLRSTLDHEATLRLMSDLDLLNGWTRNGAATVAVGGDGVRPVRSAAAAAIERPRLQRLDYQPILDALGAEPDGLTFGECADLMGLSRTHGGLKNRMERWRADGTIIRTNGRGPGGARYRFRLAAAFLAGVEPSGPPAGERRAAMIAHVAEHGSIRSGDARRMFPNVNDASLHGDLGRLVRDGFLERTGSPASGRGGNHGSGYVWVANGQTDRS